MNDDNIPEIEEETKKRIRERVLQAEKDQLHLDRPHGIIPEITDIIESEIDEVEDISYDNGGDS